MTADATRVAKEFAASGRRRDYLCDCVALFVRRLRYDIGGEFLKGADRSGADRTSDRGAVVRVGPTTHRVSGPKIF